MNTLRKGRSLRFRLFGAGAALFLAVGIPWLIITAVLLANNSNASGVHGTANEIHVQSHVLQIGQKNLLFIDSRSSEFYKTGETQNLKEVKATEASTDKEVKTLINKTGGKMKLWCLEIQKSLMGFGKNFSELEAALRELGYKNYGLEGQLRTATSELENAFANSGDAAVVRDVLYLRLDERDYLLHHEEQDEQLVEMQIAKLRGVSNSPSAKSALNQFEAVFNSYVATLERIGLTTDEGLRAKDNKSIASIEDLSVKIADEAALAEQNARSALTWVSLLAFGLVLLVEAIGFYFLAKSFTRPIVELKDRAVEIGEGKLNAKIDIKSRDEIGVLAEAVDRTRESLRDQVVEMGEVINTLSTAAGQILTTTNELAAGASEAASAMSETTTTVEEVKQTAKLSSEKAKDVAEGAKLTGQVAETGKQSVGEAIDRMNDINEQMESIAESVVGLSEQSQAIGEIIGAVNSLAEQSNLLAVNASIEAAKAGEQGKGFTVVAQEVRSLAEQSKEATDQIRAILSDIQKATAVAVMSTERGSKAVEAGVSQSVEAGKSIEGLAASIRTATQMAVQIEASSREQSAGTDQIAASIESINQASTQTADGLKQLESAAHNLHDIGEKLKQLIEQYQT
ncbi:MAG: methyl-accepting chemotaxis protein [Desulfobacterales bacterium]|nr:methyl-accepting chemotaxis protein [Desulfobacterales bacterium]